MGTCRPQYSLTSSAHLMLTLSSESGESTEKQMRTMCELANDNGRRRFWTETGLSVKIARVDARRNTDLVFFLAPVSCSMSGASCDGRQNKGRARTQCPKELALRACRPRRFQLSARTSRASALIANRTMQVESAHIVLQTEQGIIIRLWRFAQRKAACNTHIEHRRLIVAVTHTC